MTNLTIAIDDETLRRARLRALERGTSVNALLREYLEGYAGQDRARAALDEFLELARGSQAGSGRGGRRWTRDELHERSLLR